MKIGDRKINPDVVVVNLRNAGAVGIDAYEKKLKNNMGEKAVCEDILSEARTALMFLHHGFQVTMRESPDLQIELNGEVVYAEVKHFREKKQDRIDEENMRKADGLVPVGNTIPSEGYAPWDQVAQVAIKKQNQYKENALNLLVIETDSNSVDAIRLKTAVNIYDEKVACSDASSALRRLNGLVLIDQKIYFHGHRFKEPVSGEWNVIFCPTSYAVKPLSTKWANALTNILKG